MKFNHYYNKHKDKIFAYFYYNLSNDRQIAEDLSSDTFLKAFEAFESYDDQYKFSTWIFTIARNTLYNYYKKQSITLHIDDITEMSFSEFMVYEEEFHKHIDTQIDMQNVYILMEKIPESQKDMIIMKYIQDFSTKEIAEMT